MEFIKLTESEFKNYCESNAKWNLWQNVAMAHLKKMSGFTCEYLALKDREEIVAATFVSYRKLFLKYCFAVIPRGFYIDYKNLDLLTCFHNHVMKYLKTKHCIFYKMDPYVLHKERDIDGEIVLGGEDNSNVVEHLKKLGYHHAGFLKEMTVEKEPNWMFVKQIDMLSEEELLKSFDSQTQRKIKKLKKLPIEIKELQEKDIQIFKDIMDHTSKRRGFDDHNLQYYKNLYATFGKENQLKIIVAMLDVDKYQEELTSEMQKNKQIVERLQHLNSDQLTLKQQNKIEKAKEECERLMQRLEECNTMKNNTIASYLPLAGATFICVGNEVLYLYGGAYQEYAKFSAMYALQWHMMLYALENKKTRYNFYGISGTFDKNDSGYGVYEFKRGFHGHVEELIGEFTYYIYPNLYRIYRTLSKIKHSIKK